MSSLALAFRFLLVIVAFFFSSIGTVNAMVTAGLLVVLTQASPVALRQTAEERGLAIAVPGST